MTNTRGRRTAFRGDDTGSAVAFVPILGLLLIAGVAALIGIALQDGDDAADTPAQPAISAGLLGAPCTAAAGPVPAGAQARTAWVNAVGGCVNERIEAALGSGAASTNSGFAGVVNTTTFDGRPVVVVRWTSTPPAVLSRWISLHNGYVRLASPTTTS